MPYDNICQRSGTPINPDNLSPEQRREINIVPGIRLQWNRHAEIVQLAVQPMSWGSDGGHSQPMVEGGDPRTEVALWATLGRYEINHLIRKLREARDQSYGRDE